jgi:uridylate kinase
MAKPAYRRVMVKLSGEALAGETGFGLHQPTVQRIAADLVAARKVGGGIGVVVGGGNFLRGAQLAGKAIARETADTMGMLATVMNGLALEAAITAAGGSARTLSAVAMPQVCESYSHQRGLKHFEDGHIVVFAGGTGNPYFTTDTTAVLRAAEMGCDAVLKATNVDGVYDADPKANPKAKRFDKLSHKEALDRDLKVMDATAFALARENHMPIIVFSIWQAGAVEAVLRGTGRATTVSE